VKKMKVGKGFVDIIGIYDNEHDAQRVADEYSNRCKYMGITSAIVQKFGNIVEL